VNLVYVLFQLDELTFAERSPVRGAIKNQQRPLRTHDRLQRLLFSCLIRRAERGHALPHFRPGSHQQSRQYKIETRGRTLIIPKRRAIGLLATAHLFTDINQGALPALLPLLIASNHWNYATAATLVLTANASSSFLQPVLGQLSDRFPSPWLVWVGLVVATLGMSLLGIAPGYAFMLMCVSLSGIGSAAFHPEAARLMNLAAGDRQATAMSLLSFGGNAGFALGPLMATGLTLAFGLHGTVFLLIPAAILAAVLATQLKKELPPRVSRENLEDGPAPALDDAWGPFGWLTATIVSRSVIFYGLNTFVPLYWVAVLHQSRVAGGRALTVLLISGATGTLLGGRLSDRFGRLSTILACLALVPLLLILFIKATTPALAYAALVPLGIILFAPFSVMVVLGQEYLPNRVAMASGVTMGLAGSIGGLAAPRFRLDRGSLRHARFVLGAGGTRDNHVRACDHAAPPSHRTRPRA
jgi:FSR family fosmidomycin resistance protein-like MFS transporter